MRKGVDYEKSFDKLKASLKQSNKDAKGVSPDRFAYSLGKLQMAVKEHIVNCTETTGEELYKYLDETIDDIPKDLLQRPGLSEE